MPGYDSHSFVQSFALALLSDNAFFCPLQATLLQSKLNQIFEITIRFVMCIVHVLLKFWGQLDVVCRRWQCLFLPPDPRRARLEPSHPATAKTRVDLCPSTRWSSLIFVSIRRGNWGQARGKLISGWQREKVDLSVLGPEKQQNAPEIFFKASLRTKDSS